MYHRNNDRTTAQCFEPRPVYRQNVYLHAKINRMVHVEYTYK